MTDYDKIVINLLKDLKDISLDQQRQTLMFPLAINGDVIARLKAEKVEVDKVAIDHAEIDISMLPWFVYLNEADFLARINRFSWSKPIVILSEKIFYQS